MRILLAGAILLALVGLAGCASSPNGAPGPLALNHVYSEGGISIVIARYDRRVDPATLPVKLGPLDANLPGAHIIRLGCVLENTSASDWNVEPRLQATASGGSIQGSADLPPVIINTTLTHDINAPVDESAVYRVPAHQTVIRTLYFQITADLHTMSLYLNQWTPGKSDNASLAPLFTLDVTPG